MEYDDDNADSADHAVACCVIGCWFFMQEVWSLTLSCIVLKNGQNIMHERVKRSVVTNICDLWNWSRPSEAY